MMMPTTTLLAAAAEPVERDASVLAETAPTVVEPVLLGVVLVGLLLLTVGMLVCLWKIVKGPQLPDRVLAADLLSMKVVGLVVLLGMALRTDLYFDAALVVAIIGFVSTVAFSQYIGARGKACLEDETGRADTGAVTEPGAQPLDSQPEPQP